MKAALCATGSMDTTSENSTATSKSKEAALVSVLQRHGEERTALKKKYERIRSGIPRKDKVGRERAAEDAAAEEKTLLEAQAVERKDHGITDEDVRELAKISIADDASGQKEPTETTQGESKAARRRRKKAEQEAEVQRRIGREKAKTGKSMKAVELEAIEDQLKTKNLRIHPIAADGHCLYSAIAHQMNVQDIPSSVPASVEGLRNAAADHLLQHRDEFIPFVDGVNGDDAAFEGYCEQLRNTAAWGGQIELSVLATVLSTPIEVYAADLPVVKMGNSQSGDNTDCSVLRVSFHRRYLGLGEHYNSVVPRTTTFSNMVKT